MLAPQNTGAVGAGLLAFKTWRIEVECETARAILKDSEDENLAH
jgi:hypothetical protein